MSSPGLVHISDETYITDRDDVSRTLLPGADIHIDYDLDRAGSKGRLEVSVLGEHLSANTWLSTYRTVTPEIGPIQRWQLGHWRLGRPGLSSGGAWSMSDGQRVSQSAQGSDIVSMIAAAGLTEPFYTPVNGVVMTDVAVLLQMATCGDMGPNLIANGGFEADGASWSIGSDYGWDGTDNWSDVYSGSAIPSAEGTKMWVAFSTANRPINANRYAFQAVTIPAGAQYLYLSGLSCTAGEDTQKLIVDFGAAGRVTAPTPTPYVWNKWVRHFVVAKVPPGVTTANVIAVNTFETAGNAFGQVRFWDDIRIGTCTQLPLPANRIVLPLVTSTATTRIQTAADKSIGYDAINADRLAAISHYAMSTDYSGCITTSPITALASRQARYTFGANDSKLLSTDVTIPAGNEEVYNHWRAIKEDQEDGANSLIAHSYNRNPNDEYSIVNTGARVSAPPIYVQDAVNQAALKAAADQARDSYSTKETVTLSTMLLPDLTVYDAIKFEDPALPYLSGLWAVNSIDQGDETMTITATRAIGGGS